MKTKLFMLLAMLTIAAMIFSACAPPPAGPAAPAAAPAAAAESSDETGDYTTPHPLLSDKRIREAIAHCIDRDSLIASVYPYVEDKAALRIDSFLPKSHWAYKGPYKDYAFDPEVGKKLLEEAGWADSDGDGIRDQNGNVLAIKFTTTTAQFRQTWAAVAEQNLADCGIQMIRLHVPASWWFGAATGLRRRDFELGALAWVGQANPSGRTLYACSQIPLGSNNWQGQNYMGWCNETASQAIILANNTLNRDERIAAYDTVQKEFAEDMISFPLFQRAEAEAWGKNLLNFKGNPTEYSSANSWEWELADGGDTVVAGFSQEPSTMFSNNVSAAVQRQAAQMAVGNMWTQYNYDYQDMQQDQLSTLENGLATNEMVEVKVGDMVYDVDGNPVALEKGVQLMIDNQTVEYNGTDTIQLPQLVVTYKLKPYTWSDGTPGATADLELAHKIECDKTSGAVSYTTCDAIQNVTFGPGLEAQVTYLPGYQNPVYFLWPWTEVYPSHQVLSDGRNLKDVPAVEWQTLPEIAQNRLSYGPFVMKEWIKGDRMVLEANPYFQPAPKVKQVIIVFIQDTNQAVAQLLSGEVDYLERATLGGGAEVQTVIDAAKEDKVNVEIIPSPTWEHIDMNLFTK